MIPPEPVPNPDSWRPGRWVRLRLYLSAGILAALFGGLGYRAWVLQVREAQSLKQMAEDQYLQSVELPPKRGRIYDRVGGELAASVEIDSIHVNARQIVGGGHAPEAAKALATALHMTVADVEKKLRERHYFTWLKRRVPPEEARSVRELGLAGVFVDAEPRRYYPQRWLAGPLIGWAGLDSVGQEGMELSYDKDLRGARAAIPGLRDALGRAVLTGGLGDADTDGHDLHTSIDRFIQYRLERALERGVATSHAKAGVAVALDPNTGEVLAMASVPSLNPNEPGDGPAKGARNRSVTDPFEPGSTAKTFAIASALEPGLVKPDDKWFCENGHYQVGPAVIHDAERIGVVTTTGVLAESSNICTAKIAFRAGKERLREMLVRFGFGQKTGIDVPGERAGNIRQLAKMGPVETATTSFGQGMTATPLQIAAAYAAVANGGVWRQPHLMRRVVDSTGQVLRTFQPASRRVVSEELAATLRTMLFAVTQKGGTAEKLSLPGYSYGGKTGTAQKVDPATRHYSQEKWASSFVGFAPRENPRVVLFVMIDEPQGTHYGSAVAGPVWQEVMIDSLRWLGVAPERREVATPQPQAQLVAPSAPAETAPLEPAMLGDRSDEDEVPDFVGLSVREALVVAKRAGLELSIVGSGVATGQDPAPGDPAGGGVARVVFAQ